MSATNSSAPATSSTNVLVVEDEMVLRLRAVDIVEDAGFTAVEAVSADEALAILESRSDISLLFSNIQMPGSMDGLMLARAVHERWPAIKIILVSGQIKVSDADKPADSRFFGKPLVVKDMIAELQQMVGAGALSRRDTRPSNDFAITRAMSRAPSWIERGTLRIGVFGQHWLFKAQA